MVFQCPWGTAAGQRSPRIERPRRRAILVDTPLSSITSLTARSRKSSLNVLMASLIK